MRHDAPIRAPERRQPLIRQFRHEMRLRIADRARRPQFMDDLDVPKHVLRLPRVAFERATVLQPLLWLVKLGRGRTRPHPFAADPNSMPIPPEMLADGALPPGGMGEPLLR